MLVDSRHLRVVIGRHNAKAGFDAPPYFNTELDVPLICKSDVVGAEVAKEALETFYRITHFEVTHISVRQQFLDQKVWGIVKTKNAVGHIKLKIPRFEGIEYSGSLDEMRYHMSSLKGLKTAQANIVLVLEPSRLPRRVTTETVQAEAKRRTLVTGRSMTYNGGQRCVRRWPE